jgi:hypothetical protein
MGFVGGIGCGVGFSQAFRLIVGLKRFALDFRRAFGCYHGVFVVHEVVI